MGDNQIDTASIVDRLTEQKNKAERLTDAQLWNLFDDAILEIVYLKNMVDTGTAFAERVADIVSKRVMSELRGEA
jgi:hypothetical protein